MPIIRFDFSANAVDFHGAAWPEGAYCPFGGSDNSVKEIERRNGKGLILWNTHVGLCIWDREYNGYDDSDFYMLVWNEEKQEAEEICFASTRGWSYPSYGSKPDATPEVLAKFEAWKEKMRAVAVARNRAEKAKELKAYHAKELKVCAEYGFSLAKLRALKFQIGSEKMEAVMVLMTASLRSTFRKSLRFSIVKWLKEENPAYPSPLSRKQWEYV